MEPEQQPDQLPGFQLPTPADQAEAPAAQTPAAAASRAHARSGRVPTSNRAVVLKIRRFVSGFGRMLVPCWGVKPVSFWLLLKPEQSGRAAHAFRF